MNPPRTYGLIGYPLKHSLSPLMQNAAFRALKINAEYKLFELKTEELENFLNTLSEKEIDGLNVTVPYKERVISFLGDLSDEARLIGAVNTIKVVDTRLCGFNTDGEGFLQHIKQDLGFYPQGKNIAIIGAGGASRAISVYLSKAQVAKIAIYDIEKAKARRLVNYLKENFKEAEFKAADSVVELGIKDCNLLINATPVGMKESDSSLVAKESLPEGLLVYDLIYNPPETKLLRAAKEKGLSYSNGLGMLLYQGALSFEIWTGRPAPLEVMRRALDEGVKGIC